MGAIDSYIMDGKALQWVNRAITTLTAIAVLPTTDKQLKQVSTEYNNAPIAIWLSILLDEIPENFVVGLSTLGQILSAELFKLLE